LRTEKEALEAMNAAATSSARKPRILHTKPY